MNFDLRKNRARLFVFTAAAIMACAVSSHLRLWEEQVAGQAVVQGFVVDAENGLPIANATVQLAGQQVVTDQDGIFQKLAPEGRVRVSISSPLYLSANRDVLVGTHPLALPFRMLHKGPVQSVGPEGATIAGRTPQVAVTIPQGAYRAPVMVSVTDVGPAHASVMPVPTQFVDGDVPHRVSQVVAFDSSTDPEMAVAARVPVPVDVTAADVQIYAIDQIGTRAPFEPAMKAVSAGVLTFGITRKGIYAVTFDTRKGDGGRVGYVVLESGGLPSAGQSSGSTGSGGGSTGSGGGGSTGSGGGGSTGSGGGASTGSGGGGGGGAASGGQPPVATGGSTGNAGAGSALHEGDLISAITVIGGPGQPALSVIDPYGNRIDVAAGAQARLNLPVAVTSPPAPADAGVSQGDGGVSRALSSPTAAAGAAPGAGKVEVLAGLVQATLGTVAPATGVRLELDGRNGHFTAVAGAFSVLTCASAGPKANRLEVLEGVVHADVKDNARDVTGPAAVTFCDGCSGDAVPRCSTMGPVEVTDGGVDGSADALVTPARDSSASDAVTAGTEGFLGIWQSVTGGRTLTCPNQPPQTTDVTGTVAVLPGSDSPLLLTPAGSGCGLPLDFSGTTASLRTAQSCPAISGTSPSGAPFTETDTYTAATFVVNGTSATMAASGTAQVMVLGQPASCTFIGFGTLVRVSGGTVPPPDAGAADGNGNGNATGLTINPGSRDFGSIAVGSSSPPAMFTITNNGNQPAPLMPAILNGNNEFLVLPGGCPPQLAPRASCPMAVVFRPMSVGAKNAQLSASGTPSDVGLAFLTGTGVVGADAGAPDAMASNNGFKSLRPCLNMTDYVDGTTVTFDLQRYMPACLRVKVGANVTFIGDFAMNPLRPSQRGDTGRGDGIQAVNQGNMAVFGFKTPGTYAYFSGTSPVDDGTGMAGAIWVTP